MRALYRIRHKSKRPRYLPGSSHAGLWYDKFCNAWEQRDNHHWVLPESQKRAWLQGLLEFPVGEGPLLQEYTGRMERLVGAQGGRWVDFATTGPFLPGLWQSHPLRTSLHWHPTLGVPYLPGSAFKGVLRRWAGYWQAAPQELVARIFGTTEQAGSLVFMDVLPLEPVRLMLDVATPHFGDYYAGYGPPADWCTPRAQSFLAVDTGQTFRFAALPRELHHPQAQQDLAQMFGWLKECLDWTGAGGRTSVGYGRFHPLEDDPEPG